MWGKCWAYVDHVAMGGVSASLGRHSSRKSQPIPLWLQSDLNMEKVTRRALPDGLPAIPWDAEADRIMEWLGLEGALKII